MRLAIVGSHEWRNQLAYNEMHAMVVCTLKLMLPDEVVSGGAEGVDTVAEQTAAVLGIPTRIFRPEVRRWEDHGKFKGFKTRNLEIATYCTHLVAFRDSTSTTRGSAWTYDRADEMGKWARLITL